MLIGEIAAVREGNYVIDVCGAPGGKALHIADLLQGTGHVEARDLTDAKIDMINSNIKRCQLHNIEAVRQDALVFDEQSADKADILIADLPCSGLGVIGRKSDIKYHMSVQQQHELACGDRDDLRFALCLLQRLRGVEHDLCAIGRPGRLSGLFLYARRQIAGYKRRQKHDQKGYGVPRVVGVEG